MEEKLLVIRNLATERSVTQASSTEFPSHIFIEYLLHARRCSGHWGDGKDLELKELTV